MEEHSNVYIDFGAQKFNYCSSGQAGVKSLTIVKKSEQQWNCIKNFHREKQVL